MPADQVGGQDRMSDAGAELRTAHGKFPSKCESPVFSYTAHLCAVGFHGAPPMGSSPLAMGFVCVVRPLNG